VSTSPSIHPEWRIDTTNLTLGRRLRTVLSIESRRRQALINRALTALVRTGHPPTWLG
jgi:hypothetical protein